MISTSNTNKEPKTLTLPLPLQKNAYISSPLSSSSTTLLRPPSLFPSSSPTHHRPRATKKQQEGRIRCALTDLIGGDLIKADLGKWLDDVEKHKALAVYSPHEGGYEGRYLNRLRYKGYRFLDLTARSLGDPESTLTTIHPVCPRP